MSFPLSQLDLGKGIQIKDLLKSFEGENARVKASEKARAHCEEVILESAPEEERKGPGFFEIAMIQFSKVLSRSGLSDRLLEEAQGRYSNFLRTWQDILSIEDPYTLSIFSLHQMHLINELNAAIPRIGVIRALHRWFIALALKKGEIEKVLNNDWEEKKISPNAFKIQNPPVDVEDKRVFKPITIPIQFLIGEDGMIEEIEPDEIDEDESSTTEGMEIRTSIFDTFQTILAKHFSNDEVQGVLKELMEYVDHSPKGLNLNAWLRNAVFLSEDLEGREANKPEILLSWVIILREVKQRTVNRK